MGDISHIPIPQNRNGEFKVRHEKGSTIYAQNDRVGHWFEILSGAVRTCRIRADGGRRVTGFFFAGDVIGVATGRRLEMADALTDTLLCGHPSLTSYDNNRPQVADLPLRRALEAAQTSLFLLGRSSAAERLAAFLISISMRIGKEGKLPLPMNRDDIADHLGMTPHTVSRTIRAMERSGIVSCCGRNSIHILDANALLALVGEEWPTADLAIRARDRTTSASAAPTAPSVETPAAQTTRKSAQTA